MAIVDEGLEILHEDLADNVLAGQSYNFLDNTNDPTLDPALDNQGDHGTSVAGIIGMKAYNNVGGVGIAYDASLVGYNYLEAQSSTNFSKSSNVMVCFNSFFKPINSTKTTTKENSFHNSKSN